MSDLNLQGKQSKSFGRRSTFFIDIDGTLVHHKGGGDAWYEPLEPVDGAVQFINALEKRGHSIILTTSRRESNRYFLTSELERVGICYDELIMGLPSGSRIVINDLKPDHSCSAYAYVVDRNKAKWEEMIEHV